MLETSETPWPLAAMDRLNPVTLIAGAATAFGAARAFDLAKRSQGGLILADADEAAISALADDLDARNIAPERVSTLAFSCSDAERWTAAMDFISAQYGRLDWAIVCPAPASPNGSELLDFSANGGEFNTLAMCLQALTPLIGRNLHGGAIVVAAPDASGSFPKFIHGAAQIGSDSNVRIHGLALGAAQAPAWTWARWLHEMVRETGNLRAAFDRLSRTRTPMARCSAEDDLKRVIDLLLSDDTNLNGAVLAVDAEQAL